MFNALLEIETKLQQWQQAFFRVGHQYVKCKSAKRRDVKSTTIAVVQGVRIFSFEPYAANVIE